MPKAATGVRAAEQALLAELDNGVRQKGAIFILGAPRTGSTVLYQAMAHAFALPYIANFTNDHFAETPIVGLAIQKSVPVIVGLESAYGKAAGNFQTSEGSAVLMHWFGGGHPSALVSARILDGREPHMLSTFHAAERLFGQPLLIKNPWNCFRVADLSRALPGARFVWLRRDIVAAARSDLAARWATKGTDTEWNSATPENYEKLRQLLPAEQVVENQFEFNRAIATALDSVGAARFVEVWYEDFLHAPADVLASISARLGLPSRAAPLPPGIFPPAQQGLGTAEPDKIEHYVAAQGARLSVHRYPQRGGR